MMMPVMDGRALIAALRTMAPAVRVIGTSGLDIDDDFDRASREGVEDFLPKPYTTEALLCLLQKVLARA
jgi:CheY-like chemotaxis protein